MLIRKTLKNGIKVFIKGLLVKKNDKQYLIFTRVNPTGIVFNKSTIDKYRSIS